MAAAQTPGTPAPAPAASNVAPAGQETTATAAGAESETTTPAADAPALADLPKKQKAYRDKKKADKAAGKTEAPADEWVAKTEGEGEPKPEPAKEAVSAEKLFTPDALATPEGIGKAREILLVAKSELEKSWRRFDRADMRVKERDAKTAERETSVVQREEAVTRVTTSLQNAFAVIRGQRRSAPEMILSTLDYVAGGRGDVEAGRELFEQMALAIARDGKPEAMTTSEKRLQEQIQQMQEAQRREAERYREAQLDHAIDTRKGQIAQRELQIGTHAITSGDFPGIAGFASQGGTNAASVGKWIGDVMQDAHARGEPLDVLEAIGILDAKLAPYRGQRAAQAENGSDPPNEVELATPLAKKGARQSTVLPIDADRSSGTSRKESREERRARLSRDPAFLKRLSPVIARAAGIE